MRKSWVVSSQCICAWRIWVATYAQRRCCHSVYMSKVCVVSSQCIWLWCMYINLIKRKIDWFTASHKHVDVQKLSRVFAMYMCVMYMSCSVCTKTLLSFCVYKQRLYHVFAVYIFATYVNRLENRNWLIYYIAQMCMCAKAESCLCNDYVNVVY